MKRLVLLPLLIAAAPAPQPKPVPAPSPAEIVAAAKAEEWVAIDPKDILVMELVGIPDGKLLKPRRVVIQLMPPPFSQGWIGNIRKLAAAKWYDGTSVNRVQDNYVVQWGDATEKKALPPGLVPVPESNYRVPLDFHSILMGDSTPFPRFLPATLRDAFAPEVGFAYGWPVSASSPWPKSAKRLVKLERNPSSVEFWPTHCYGMVGVGRNLSPDTGSGAELYTVIGHAPRHLDRNIALVGRVIEGIEHLSSLPRGTEALGFYKTEQELVPIVSIRLATDLPAAAAVPRYEYLSTESASFTRYADARANRRDEFFIRPAGGADICNIPVPVRRKP